MSAGHAQRCLAASGLMASHCRPRRHRLSAFAPHQKVPQHIHPWREITGLTLATEGPRPGSLSSLTAC